MSILTRSLSVCRLQEDVNDSPRLSEAGASELTAAMAHMSLHNNKQAAATTGPASASPRGL
jgi:hypothetical protein